MFRIRSKKLLSGVSTLAVLAAFGAVDPVLADTISGPGNVPAINTDDLADLGPVTIDTNANVQTDGSGRSFYNPNLNILGAAASTAVTIVDSVLQGSIVNDGSISSTAADAINISDSIINGGIFNNNVINAVGDAIDISAGVFHGGIANDGSIIAGSTGIYLTSDLIFTGGILNSGVIDAANEGISIGDGVSFSGGINNTGTIDAGTSGIYIDADSFSGGITNSGLITTSTSTGIYWSGDVFSGGINNTDTGTINADTGYGVYLGGNQFSGGVTNAGLITAPSNYGLYIDTDHFQGGVNNSGTISSLYTALSVYGDVFQGGITNSGLITSVSSYGVYIDSTLFQGGVNNTSSGTISSLTTALYIASDTFEGGVTNAGLIQSTSSYGLYVSSNLFEGGINNTSTGTILGGITSYAVYLNASTFNGGLTNSGLISAPSYTAVYLSNTLFQGGINNTSTGTIIGGSGGYGIYSNNYTFNGGITNAGLIQAGGTGTGIYINDYAFNGGITNSGTINAGATSGYGIYDNSYAFSGGINNTSTGTIWAPSTAIYINDYTFDGGITNSGLITSTSYLGISINNTSFTGGINNTSTGTISSYSTAIYVNNTTFDGGITNAGLIDATNAGIAVYINNTSFTGGINNTQTGIIGGYATGIYINSTTFSGGITNAGLIGTGGATSATYGIVVDSDSFAGGINNTATGTIMGSSTAIELNGTTFAGGITNAGLIQSTDNDAIEINGTNFAGGINNSSTGTITGETGIDINVTNFTGGITNAGVIEGTTSEGLDIDVTTFTGGINNTGTIIAQSSGEGIELDATTFEGGITNSGLIQGGTSEGVDIDVTNFSGGFNNTATGVIRSRTSTGVYVSTVTNWTGGFTNAGTILGATSSAYGSGVYLDVTNFSGNFVNSGLISGGLVSGIGVDLTGALFDGSVTNSGTIIGTGGYTGLYLGHDLYTGNVTNTASGKITGGTYGVYVDNNVTIAGSFNNAGVIDPSYGLYVDGAIQGGIFNSGVILGTVTAIDLSAANGTDPLDPTIGHTITQTGGLIQGNDLPDGTGNIMTALDLNNALIDTFNGNGGTLDGDVIGDGTDNFNVGGNFVYLRGAASGIDQLSFNSGVGAFGLNDADMDGLDDDTGAPVVPNTLTFTAEDMNINAGGTAYLGDLTTITVNDDLTIDTDGTLAYFLTTDTATHGQINVTDDSVLAGNLAAVIDPASFAAAPIAASSAFTYFDVITTGGTRTGTFDNSGSIQTSSIFFTGKALYDGDNVDISLHRLAFNDALNIIGAIESQNQDSVAAAIEEIYSNGGYSGDFEDLLLLFFSGGLTAAQFQAILDDLSGSEHAQLQGSVLAINGILNNFMTERLDGAKLTQGGSHFASLEQRFAQAAAPSTSDAMSPNSYGSHGLTRGKSGVSVWARVFGQWDHNDGDIEAASFDQDSTGIAVGADYAIDNNAMVGVAANFANTDVDFDTPGDSADIDSWQIGAYGSYGFGRFYLDGQASYAGHDLSTVRTILPPVPGAPFSTAAGYDASTWSLAGEIGGIWRLGRVDLQPSAHLAWTSSDTDGFSESGTGPGGILDLLVQGSDADSLASTLAIRGSGVWTMGRTKVVPDIKIGWRHEFSDDRYSFVAAFAEDPSTTFTIVSSGVQEDSAVVSAGAIFGLTSNFEVFVDFNGNYGSDLSQTNASGGVRLTW